MKNFFTKIKNQKGYAILFTVVIISAISVITAGLTNAVYKQLILSSLAKDSQSAFYQADTAADCALYADQIELVKPSPNIFTTGSFNCGGATMLVDNITADGYDIHPQNETSQNSCFRINVTRTTTGPSSPSWNTGLVSWWKFDGNANDSVGANNGTAENNATLTNVNCKSGQCYNFDPNWGSQISVPDNSSLDLTNYTISAWVYPTDVTSWRTIIGKGSNPMVMNYVWQLGGSDSILEDGYDNAFWAKTSSPKYNANTLYFVTAVADSSNSKLKIYVNGVEQAYSTQTWGGLPKNNNNNLYIGASEAWGEFFKGNIDEVMIWNRVLSDTEIQEVRDSFDAPASSNTTTTISAKGYNICNKSNLRTVEREIQINYEEVL